MEKQINTIAVVGLGYVGLPLAVEFGLVDKFRVIGFDISEEKITELSDGIESMDEVDKEKFASAQIEYTSDPSMISEADFVVVAVPTPILQSKQPDLTAIRDASATVGSNLKSGAIVVYESTVYPGVTEEVCVPILEDKSGLKSGEGFKVGYSPERVNPGDKEHTIDKIVKVVSAQDESSLEVVSSVYLTICSAGVHKAPSIMAAEAAKVIENTQRDLNIALVNELALIFSKIGLNTKDVIDAAATKWNFQPYYPGLVGGHCIGVDPYYLTYKAQELNYYPEVILSGRRINDTMPQRVAEMASREVIKSFNGGTDIKTLVLGGTFKEDVKDKRNSKVRDVVDTFSDYGFSVDIYDPLFKSGEKFFGLENLGSVSEKYHIVFVGAYHSMFKDYVLKDFQEMIVRHGLLVDIRSYFRDLDFEVGGINYLSL